MIYVDNTPNFLISGDTSKGQLGVTAIPGKEEEFKTNFQTTINYAKAVNASKVHIMAGKVDTATPANWKTYEDNLKFATKICESENIIGLLEPINQHTVPTYFLSDYNKSRLDDIAYDLRLGALNSNLLQCKR